MPVWTPLAAAANTSLNVVTKVRTTTVTMQVNGLLPNAQYTFWWNGADMTWACRTPGTRMGSGLFSDDSGSITVLFACEIYPDIGAAEGASSANTKYHNAYLKDVNGIIRSTSMAPQTLVRK